MRIERVVVNASPLIAYFAVIRPDCYRGCLTRSWYPRPSGGR